MSCGKVIRFNPLLLTISKPFIPFIEIIFKNDINGNGRFLSFIDQTGNFTGVDIFRHLQSFYSGLSCHCNQSLSKMLGLNDVKFHFNNW